MEIPTTQRRRIERPRTRMLTFRVTDVQFEELQAAAARSGARWGLSDFLRHAAMEALNPAIAPQPNPSVTQKILDVEERMGLLETRLSDLIDLSAAQGVKRMRRRFGRGYRLPYSFACSGVLAQQQQRLSLPQEAAINFPAQPIGPD